MEETAQRASTPTAIGTRRKRLHIVTFSFYPRAGFPGAASLLRQNREDSKTKMQGVSMPLL
jgi:hypothetical protein